MLDVDTRGCRVGNGTVSGVSAGTTTAEGTGGVSENDLGAPRFDLVLELRIREVDMLSPEPIEVDLDEE